MFSTQRIRIISSDTQSFGSLRVDKKSPTPYSDATKVKEMHEKSDFFVKNIKIHILKCVCAYIMSVDVPSLGFIDIAPIIICIVGT